MSVATVYVPCLLPDKLISYSKIILSFRYKTFKTEEYWRSRNSSRNRYGNSATWWRKCQNNIWFRSPM